jgi:hypothetical protein
VRTYYVGPLPPLHITDGAAFNTFTTFQSIAPTPAVVLPANILEPGSELRLEYDGEFSNTGTPTLGLGFLYGATALAVGTAITTTTTAAQSMPVTLALRTVTIDTTAATAVAPGAVWGTSSVSNTIKVNRFSVSLVS